MIFNKNNPMNDVIEKQTGAEKTDKMHHGYTKYYHYYFEKIRNEKITLLEIGVGGGGCLKMFLDYFPNSTIYGIDNNPEYTKYENDRIKIRIGDQKDISFLNSIIEEISDGVDILIDDGGHFMDQQIITFDNLYPLVKPNGVYVVEDLFTSYDGRFMNQEYTMSEYIKDLSDLVHKRTDPKTEFEKYFMSSILGLHLFEKICFFFKKGKN